MWNFGSAVEGLFYLFITMGLLVVVLGGYLLWNIFFAQSSWDICSQLSEPTVIVQCMEAIDG